jgi:DNA-directed RNA polymerase specialized sigma24 family protein
LTRGVTAPSHAFLVLLGSLTPVERAVFLLREVFDYDYPQIAKIEDRSEANGRQIVVRARKHVRRGPPAPRRRRGPARRPRRALPRRGRGR